MDFVLNAVTKKTSFLKNMDWVLDDTVELLLSVLDVMMAWWLYKYFFLSTEDAYLKNTLVK